MKKFYSLIFISLALLTPVRSQVAWNQIKVSTTKTPSADTAYFAINCRGGLYQSINAYSTDSVNALVLPTSYNPGASLVWYVVQGAPYGTIPRVRLVNSLTGKYLYIGKKGTNSKQIYPGARVDPYGGQKDLFLVDMGTKSTTQYYALQDNDGDRIGNWTTGLLSIYASTGAKYANAANQWIFSSRQGQLPKPSSLSSPEISFSSSATTFYANGNASIDVTLKKGTTDFTSQALLYHGNTLIDTLEINNNGQTSFTYKGLSLGAEQFTVVYPGDEHYDPSSATISLTVVEALTALKTSLSLTLPSTAEVHSEATIKANVIDSKNNAVTSGSVLVYINNILKNKLEVNAQGTASLSIPTLLAGTQALKAVYVGDGIQYLNSDTITNSLTVGLSASAELPYPVYFDLCSQPEVRQWNYRYPVTLVNATSLSHLFPQDSIAGVKLESDTARIKYNSLALNYSTTDYKDYYNHADNLVVSLGGGGRSKWIQFATPWLNKGSYNIYLSQRLPNSSIILPITSITLDNKELYWPEQELTGRWLNYSGTANNTRRWNAKGHSALLPLSYLGSVYVDKSDVHNLILSVADQGGSDAITLDMLEFIPVDQDSLKLTNSATVNFSTLYYPLFDLGAFPRYQGDIPYSSYANYAFMSLPFQQKDKTERKQIGHTITDLIRSNPDDYPLNAIDYVVVYKKDKWTRVAEGAVNDDQTFAVELEKGDYYYEEINYAETDPSCSGYRSLLKTGSFSISENTGTHQQESTQVRLSVRDQQLTIQGLNNSVQIQITDLSGRIVYKSDQYTSSIQLPSRGVFILTIHSNGKSESYKVISQ